MSSPLVIYHAHCDDGFGAAYAAWQHFGDQAEYYPASHGSQPPSAQGRVVYLLDFSYKRAVLTQLIAEAKTVIILDHHQTAQEDLMPLLTTGQLSGEFDLSRSGAIMAWHYFHPDTPPPPLLQHVQDVDLWQFNLPGSKEISLCLRSHPHQFELWQQFMFQTEQLQAEGAIIARFFQRKVQELTRHAVRSSIAGYEVPVCNAPHLFVSDLAHELSKGEPFAAVYHDTADARSFSLRSQRDGGIDVAKIAEQFGGGGHRHAAGFRTARPVIAL
jgi:oligoribonuclease NrnB/cAMP/cGMP phosphodiesterase (DHH superfamily)